MKQYRSVAKKKRGSLLSMRDCKKRQSHAYCFLAECRYLPGVSLIMLNILLNRITETNL